MKRTNTSLIYANINSNVMFERMLYERILRKKTMLISGKNLPVHCVVETIHNIVETHVSNSRENWRRPQVETDSYVIIPVAMPFQVSISFFS